MKYLIPLLIFYIFTLISSVISPDPELCGTSGRRCAQGYTCCKCIYDPQLCSNGWRCYAETNGVCCSDGKTCCPYNNKCVTTDGKTICTSLAFFL